MKRGITEYKVLACLLVLLGLTWVLSGCGQRAISLPANLAGADALPGWMPDGDVQVFDRETIYHLVDGQADVFLAYGFEQVTVRRYRNAAGTDLDIHIWQLATPTRAYGLFSMDISGTPVDIGNDGDLEPGHKLSFWQNRYTVWVRARPELDDAELRRFAETVSEALPKGGKRPALMGRMPPGGLMEQSAVFFHEEISIQDRLWLGGENLLGLSPKTDGVLARYEIDGVTAQLLLVQYPGGKAAGAGMAALSSSQTEGLVAAKVHDTLLGAVFGKVDKATANELLAEAVGGQ